MSNATTRRSLLQGLAVLPVVMLGAPRVQAAGFEFTEGERVCLAFAATSFDGGAGAIFPHYDDKSPEIVIGSQRLADGTSVPLIVENTRLSYMRTRNGLCARGLLSRTDKVPDHPYALCGWYTITERGREAARHLDCEAIVQTEMRAWRPQEQRTRVVIQ